ncbi:unnamed protein product [Fraxinus pennsylvanica]|uniref:Uncharacterized protein n=1 Tax=Fraxinus pennsylvanica TaxID=56036 RepID=A0AAD2DVM6_9LAMI|nr:unnamed protein product [Fraxinus pennsylvanica]
MGAEVEMKLFELVQVLSGICRTEYDSCFCAAALCAFIAPAAAGSGIPEVKAYLNGVDAHSILALSTLFVKVGFVVGKEKPIVHTGAYIANFLGQGGSSKYRLTWKWLRYFKNDRDRRDLITCGVAAGVAAAFRSPVDGVLFALEEAASWMMGHNGFPVIDEPPFSDAPELCGLVLRGLRVEDLDISVDEMEMYVDLHPVTNTSPYTVVETISLATASVLFRQLGLRHLCVVPKTPGLRNLSYLLSERETSNCRNLDTTRLYGMCWDSTRILLAAQIYSGK